MSNNIPMNLLLSKISNNDSNNLKNIKKRFGDLNYKDKDNQTILHILVDDKYDEEKCFLAIKTLLNNNLNPNALDDFKYNFIQTALYTGYSEDFIIKIIKEALKFNLNINHIDSDKDTIMHTAIYSDDYLGEVINIYKLLCENGFDSNKTCCEGRTLIEAMIYQKQYSQSQIKTFEEYFLKNIKEQRYSLKQEKKTEESITFTKNATVNNDNNQTVSSLSDKTKTELEKFGIILNNKIYNTSPIIGRDNELMNLMITLAQDKKNALIVGESGVGKTAIVEEFAYRIKTGQVPNFLQNRIILEVNPSDVVAGCQYVGQFENNMNNLMRLCEKNNVIIFIDEIHTIYGIGSTKGKDNDMASMLKYYVDRCNLKVIGTTTEKEYNEFFSSDALKRRFEKIIVKEPEDNILYEILNKVIEDYCLKNNLMLENEIVKKDIINIILLATEKNHRVYNDIVNNPDLAISIIDKAFAFAKVYNSEFITVEHFIKSFEYCDRIYETTKEQSILKLKKININKQNTKSKILTFDVNKYMK